MQFFRDFLRAFIVGIAIFITLITIQYLNGYDFSSIGELGIYFLYNQMYALPLFFVNAYYYRFLEKIWGSETFALKNLYKGAIGGIAITIFVLFLIRLTIEIIIEGTSVSAFFEQERIQNYYAPFILSILITSIFYCINYYQNRQKKVVAEQKIIAGTASAKFDALKSQLDPHFLFNSLNVLTSLIEENPEAAGKFTTSLSKVYRYVLEQKDKELVTLKEELKFADRYISLLMMRFENSIVYSAPKQLKNPEAKVVPLSLQLLLENAVKHNQLTASKKLHITLTEKDGRLIVSNTIQPKKVLKKGAGVGLKNIQNRYALLTSQPILISKNEKEFKVVLPILSKEMIVSPTPQDLIFEKRYENAKRQVETLKMFYLHLGVYLISIPIFIYMNYLSETNFPWALFPIIGWGLGISGHAAQAFHFNPFFGKKWEERKIKKLIEKDQF